MAEQERVKIRRRFFTRIFQNLKSLIPEIYAEAYFDDEDALFLAELYFAMNDPYKEWRVEERHYTNDYKGTYIRA